MRYPYFIEVALLANRDYYINKKIVCITDIDPARKKKVGETKFKKCYPFEYDVNPEEFDYIQNSVNHPSDNIKIFTPCDEKGKTFEYELARYNRSLKLLLTESTSNIEELSSLDGLNLEQCMDRLRTCVENNNMIESIAACGWDKEDKKSALIAARYLNSITKGENALELSYLLEENHKKKDGDESKCNFTVPEYIKNALVWIIE